MKQLNLAVAGLVAGLGLAACTGNNTQVPVSAVTVTSPQVSALEFAVGRANIAGVATGMNVVAIMRQANGQSSVLVDTPTLTGPFTLPATTGDAAATTGNGGSTATSGPSAAEIAGTPPNCGGKPCITGTPQQAPGNPLSAYPYLSTFGQYGGVFGMGIEPANSDPTNSRNVYLPYNVPLYPVTGITAFAPWGGAPAYDPAGTKKGTRDGTFADTTRGILGVQMGLDVFTGVIPGAGTYALNVNVPTTGGSSNIGATSTFGGGTALPAVPAPTVTFDGTGQATVSYTLPAGVTGAYVEVIDRGPALCNASGNINLYGPGTSGNTQASAPGATYYTFWVTSSGSSTITNANSPGPPGSAFPAICTAAQNAASPLATAGVAGDAVRAFVVGFDYNHYGLTYNGPLGSAYPQSPALPASADISISPPTNTTSP